MDTHTSTVNFKAQFCLVRPRQSWVQHDYKVHIKLYQFLCILLQRKNGEEKHYLEQTQSSLAQRMKAGDIHTTMSSYFNAVTCGDLTSGSGSHRATVISVLEYILNDHQHIFSTSGILMNKCMTPQGCLQALISTICTAVHYCCSSSRSGVAASQEPNG